MLYYFTLRHNLGSKRQTAVQIMSTPPAQFTHLRLPIRRKDLRRLVWYGHDSCFVTVKDAAWAERVHFIDGLQ